MYLYAELNSSDPNTLKSIITIVQNIAQQNQHDIKNLILWSHGNAWLPPNTSIYNDSTIKSGLINSLSNTKSFGLDETFSNSQNEKTNQEIDIKKLSQSLSGFHFNCIAFDACFMGSIEVIYELKNVCEYIVCSAAEISSTGFPYNQLGSIFNIEDKEFPKKLAREFSNFYEQQQGDLLSYTIIVIETAYLKNFAQQINNIYTKYSEANMLDTNTLYSYKKIQQYDRGLSNYFFDCKDFCNNFLLQKNDIVNINTFNDIWSKLVLYEKHSQKIMGTLLLKNVFGLSMYIPRKQNSLQQINNYYKTLQWYETTCTNNFWNIN